MYDLFFLYRLLPWLPKNRLFKKINHPMKLVIHLRQTIDLVDIAVYIDISWGMILHSTLIWTRTPLLL